MQAVAASEASLGREHPKTAEFLNQLAAVVHQRGRLGEAEPMMRRWGRGRGRGRDRGDSTPP